MAYTKRTITDRVADGDDCFYIEYLDDGRIKLTPAPNSVTVVGTTINKELLQPMEDGLEALATNIDCGEL